MRNVLFLIALAIMFSSCSILEGNINNQLSVAQTEFRAVPAPNPEAERILENAFSQSEIPWEVGSPEAIEKARLAIKATGEFLRSKLSLTSGLPYYSYRHSYEFVVNQYDIIARELDKRVALGAIEPKAAVIYGYVKRDITEQLEFQRKKIVSTEKEAKSQASTITIDEMKGLFNLIKPLIDVAL